MYSLGVYMHLVVCAVADVTISDAHMALVGALYQVWVYLWVIAAFTHLCDVRLLCCHGTGPLLFTGRLRANTGSSGCVRDHNHITECIVHTVKKLSKKNKCVHLIRITRTESGMLTYTDMILFLAISRHFEVYKNRSLMVQLKAPYSKSSPYSRTGLRHRQTHRKFYFTAEIITWVIQILNYIKRDLCNQTCDCTEMKLQSQRGPHHLDAFANEDEEAAFL